MGDLDHLDTPSTVVRIGSSAPEEARSLLERIRQEKPDEPLWQGIADIETDAGGVEVRFHDGVDPRLRRAGGAEVACVHYGKDAQG